MLRMILAAFLGALIAGVALAGVGYLYVEDKVDAINQQTQASFTKAFAVTTGDEPDAAP